MTRRVSTLWAVAIAMMGAACTTSQSPAPTLTGPSGLATLLSVTATPDTINQDGASRSTVAIAAQGASGQPLGGLAVRVDMVVEGVAADFGTLSARNLVTGNDGHATVLYTAPPAPPPATAGLVNRVSIVARVVGTNAQASDQVFSADIRLVPVGVILPPAGSPTASFTVSPTPVTQNIAVTFDASASTPGTNSTQITSYSWTFGDGTTAAGVRVNHAYNQTGTFSATLTVTNDRTLAASTTQAIAVSPAAVAGLPTASFTFSPAQPGVNETIFFNGSTSTAAAGHTISSYRWTFGDGGTAAGAAVTHAFATAGSYVVQLAVTDEIGQAATSPQTVVAGSSQGPTSNFSFSPASPGRNDQVVFDASSSVTAQGQTIVDVAWNFGDGTPVIHCPGSTGADCPGPTNRISAHTFLTAQTFIVNLVVTDSAGRTGSRNTPVTVVLGQPNVVITTSPSSPNPGTTTVVFNSSGTTYFPGSAPASFLWTFGDGATSTSPNPTHVYAAVGTYSVGLSVTDNKGRTGIGTAPVVVVAVTPATPPVASFSFGPPSPGAGTNVLFDGNGSTGSNLTYTWNFGDGSTTSPSGVPTVNHVYALLGPYQATLKVTDTVTGLSNTSAAQTVTVH